MRSLHVAIVGRDPHLRQLAAEVFDEAPSAWEVSIHDAPPLDADVVLDLSGELPSGDDVIPFDPSGAGDVISRIEAARDRAEGPVGVWSPCPGSGSTSVAVHLAACLAENERCTVVDLDPRRGVGVRIGCPPLDADVTDPSLRARPVAGGFRLVEGTMPRPDGGRVIVDGPAPAVLGSACAKHVVVLPSGRSGLERARERLGDLPPHVALVINRTGWGGELTRTAIAQLVGGRVALELPFSPGLRDAEDRGELLTSPFSPWLRRIRRLARAL